MGMTSAGRLLVGIALIASTMSCLKSNIATANGTGFIWIATQGNQQVSAFRIDLSSGSIVAIGTNQATGAQPSAMAITPDGKTLFIANTSDNTIGSYTVNSDGTLSGNKSPATTLAQGPSGCSSNCMSLGLSPVGMAVDASGKFLFVADQGQANNANAPGGISVFTISGTSLTSAGPACPAGFSQSACPFTIADPITGFGSGTSAVLAAPAGNFLYVTNQFTNTVQSFSYNGSGSLTSLNTFTTGNNPSALAFSRCAGVTQATTNCSSMDANTLFVTDGGANTVSTFAACIQTSATCATPNGTLVQTSKSPVPAGVSPSAVVVDPAGNFVYTVDSGSNTISQYSYSSGTGDLSPLIPASVSGGVNPFGSGITSDGARLIVSNNNGSSMSVYNVSSSGQLAPASTSSITLAGQPSAVLVR